MALASTSASDDAADETIEDKPEVATPTTLLNDDVDTVFSAAAAAAANPAFSDKDNIDKDKNNEDKAKNDK